MSGLVVARSSLTTSLSRYLRSWGLWALLVIALVASRFFVSRDDGQAVIIAVGGQLPVLTSAMLGVSLGIVVSTLMLPIGFIYLRANTTRRQPWQVEEVTTGSRVAIAFGRFLADVAVMAMVLAALTVAGWILALLAIPFDRIDLVQIAFALWLVAGPALMGTAAVRILFDSLPPTRTALGEVAFFVLWMTAIVMPITMGNHETGFQANMRDFTGFVQPLTFAAPASVINAHGGPDISIGATEVRPGHLALDVMAGLTSPGYIASRLAWAGIAMAVAAGAGLVYGPHRPRKPLTATGRLARWLSAGPPRPADPLSPPARPSAVPALGLLVGEFRLIGAGRLFLLLAAIAAGLGVVGDYRHVGSAAALLLLIFPLSAQAGRSEARGLLALTRTAMLSPWLRRVAFVLAGLGWSLLIAIPALVAHPTLKTLGLAAGIGAAASLTAMLLALLSRSAFPARLVLLIAWYAYLSS